MSSNKDTSSLRKKARDILARLPEKYDDMDKRQVHELIEELNVHQIELEIQNEELAAIHKNLEKSRQRYISLFDQSPVGYVVLDHVGIIKQFNTTFYEMVKAFTQVKNGTPFADLLESEDAGQFRARYFALVKSPQGKKIQARLKQPDGRGFQVLLEAKNYDAKGQNLSGQSQDLLLSVTDIHELQETRRALEDALEKVKTLSGLIPICSYCKNIRDDQGYWNRLEDYLAQHSDVQLSHGICQDCAKKHYPDLDLYDKK